MWVGLEGDCFVGLPVVDGEGHGHFTVDEEGAAIGGFVAVAEGYVGEGA